MNESQQQQSYEPTNQPTTIENKNLSCFVKLKKLFSIYLSALALGVVGIEWYEYEMSKEIFLLFVGYMRVLLERGIFSFSFHVLPPSGIIAVLVFRVILYLHEREQYNVHSAHKFLLLSRGSRVVFCTRFM